MFALVSFNEELKALPSGRSIHDYCNLYPLMRNWKNHCSTQVCHLLSYPLMRNWKIITRASSPWATGYPLMRNWKPAGIAINELTVTVSFNEELKAVVLTVIVIPVVFVSFNEELKVFTIWSNVTTSPYVSFNEELKVDGCAPPWLFTERAYPLMRNWKLTRS